ncbi:bifunctional L-3-cyanoalanine synthase/cysteine synthase 1, mitochondrial [Tanacetum coccineum]
MLLQNQSLHILGLKYSLNPVSKSTLKESVGSNDMVHNYYLEEDKKKAQIEKDKALKIKPNVQKSARLPNTANGSKPKPWNSILLTGPSYASLERRVIMLSFGADLILIDPTKAMRGIVKKAYDLLENTPDASMLQQLSNPTKTKVTVTMCLYMDRHI